MLVVVLFFNSWEDPKQSWQLVNNIMMLQIFLNYRSFSRYYMKTSFFYVSKDELPRQTIHVESLLYSSLRVESIVQIPWNTCFVTKFRKLIKCRLNTCSILTCSSDEHPSLFYSLNFLLFIIFCCMKDWSICIMYTSAN